jgi:energy-converting hydrogenase A subunit R
VRRVFVSDCEGPISKNDNAFELVEKLIPEGARLFRLISRYDDVQADILHRPGYRPGDTLKLILPFLKAYGATNEILRRLSAEDIRLVKGAEDTLSLIAKSMPSFIVSTSYEYYVKSLCKITEFPEENVYCTRLDLDRFKIPEWESEKLRDWTRRLVKLTPPTIPPDANSILDLTVEDRETIAFLDEIFWNEMQRMAASDILREVKPVGGLEKVESIRDIVNKCNVSATEVIYFGDSITDAEPLKYVRENGGLAVSFNGNEYAIREAELAVLSDNTLVIGILALAFQKGGIDAVRELTMNWGHEKMSQMFNSRLEMKIRDVYRSGLPQVEVINKNNKRRLIEESCSFRRKVRGEITGSLG